MFVYILFYFLVMLFFYCYCYCYYYYTNYLPYARGKIMKDNLICYLPKTQIKCVAEKESETHNLNAWFISPIVLSALSQCSMQADNWKLWYFAFKYVSGTIIESHHIYIYRLPNAGICPLAPTRKGFLSPFPTE